MEHPLREFEPEEEKGQDGKVTLKVELPGESDPEVTRIYKMLLLHNYKTFNNREKYQQEFEAKERGEEVTNPQKKLKKKSDKVKKTLKKKSKAIHRFGGKLKKKKGDNMDVCIMVKGEDGAINEIHTKVKKSKK